MTSGKIAKRGGRRSVDRGVAVLLTATAGGLIALQAPINAELGKATGSLAAALVSFTVGTMALAAIVVLSGKAGGVGSAFDVSWYYLLGGVFGAVYVFNALIAVSAIGAGGVAAATIAGQLTASVAIDRIGLFGLDEVPLTPERLLGVALLFVGTLLVIR
jgi:transporter family-2 protein